MASTPNTCSHSKRTATIQCGSYFVHCDDCAQTLITIPWFSAELLLKGNLKVFRAALPESDAVAEGSAELLVPHIRRVLACNEALRLAGEHAVIREDQLGNIKNNPLEIQKEYFTKLIKQNPNDETAPFALAQVIRELGSHEEADRWYDDGIARGKRNWFRKLPWFLVPTVAATALLLQQGFTPWLAAPVGLAGPALWLIIYRNRQRWLPLIGFSQRAETAARVDMAAAMAMHN